MLDPAEFEKWFTVSIKQSFSELPLDQQKLVRLSCRAGWFAGEAHAYEAEIIDDERKIERFLQGEIERMYDEKV